MDIIDIIDKDWLILESKNHYELDYIHFMINILKPFIQFKKSNEESHINILHFNSKSNKFEDINISEFIHFIQIVFPKLIKKKIKCIKNSLLLSNYEKDAFKIFINIGSIDFKKLYIDNNDHNSLLKNDNLNIDYNKYLDLDTNDINKLKLYYGINCKGYEYPIEKGSEIIKYENDLNEKLAYFEHLLIFNYIKHKKIKYVLRFIKNLHYVI